MSIILPTHDRLSLLRECVTSVQQQTHTRWELLVIDDGSTDGTRSFLAGIGDARIHLVEHPHCGNPAQLRNTGITRARYDMVAFIDSDDRWRPEKLERQLSGLIAQPNVGWSYTGVVLIDATGAQLPRSRFKPWHPHSGWIFELLLPHDARIACPTVLVRKDLLARTGGFDEALMYCEDYALWLRLSRLSPVLAIPEALTEVRLHTGSNTHDQPGVSVTFAEIYERELRTASSHKVRRLCRRQASYYWCDATRQLTRRGELSTACKYLARGMARRPLSRRCWWASVRWFGAVVRRLIAARP